MNFQTSIINKDGGHEPIMIISTGGTIEKTYNEEDGSLINRETVIKEKIINESRYPHHKFSIKVIMQKDSLDMDTQDRQIIFEAIMQFAKKGFPIVVLHGTDTVDKTISHCFSQLKDQSLQLSVPIVFTGAMRPLGFIDSDAKQNVLEAIMAANILTSGFYLSFHGKVFEPHTFVKNRSRRTFELK